MGATERWSRDDGFSLMELVVVTIIIGILATIAIAVFFTQREKAERSSAISSARNTSTLAEAIRLDDSTYTDAPSAYEDEGGTAFTYVNGESTGPTVVSIETYSDDGDASAERGPIVVMAAQGGGRCYWIRHDVDGAPVRDHFGMDDGDTCKAGGSVPGGSALWEATGGGW